MDTAGEQTASPRSGGRPRLVSQPSSSLPSTPYQRPRNPDRPSRSPSIERGALNGSPKSSHSDSNQSLSNQRRRTGGCKFETGMARARRRMPYSLGAEKLQPEITALKQKLGPAEDEKLSGDMRELYDRLLPSAESENRRRQLVVKLERLLNSRWPGRDIKVHVFGSSGNNLGTTDSDVDICITTPWKELEHVCILAELLASHGMERVVCVSSAKVPIVKIWDPELQLACDMNVNNTVALENTELIRSYVSLDPRVRPLAMIIKYWTRRRILNDAALGGTLSSYTWICMIINFLQTRDPPVLPTLQQQCGLRVRMMDGLNVTFDKDLLRYKDHGSRNESSLGQLLFQFFRYYGHELDLEENVISARLGKILPKMQKGWHHLQDNRLCVEEPFNTSRNLGNTADDTSMRGIHLELRRGFSVLCKGNLQACCEQYEPPKDEGRSSEIFIPPVSRPVTTQLPTQPAKTPRGGNRGGRHNNSTRITNSGGRRTSNPGGTRGSGYLRNLPFQMTAQELQLQAQHQQHLLHDRLFQQYQYLQAQEQELRMQLQQQALLQGRLPPTMSYPHIAFPALTSQDERYGDNSSSRASSVSRAPMSAPLHQQQFGYPSPYPQAIFPVAPIASNPASPHLATAIPAGSRYDRRNPRTHSSLGSLRAQSQPARPVLPQSRHAIVSRAEPESVPELTPSVTSMQDYLKENAAARSSRSTSQASVPRRPPEYIGWYVGQSPSLLPYSRSAGISPVPSHVGLAIRNGGLSPRAASRSTILSSAMNSPPSERAQGAPANNETGSRRGRPTSPQQPQALTIITSSPPSSPKGAQRALVETDLIPSVGSNKVEEQHPEHAELMTFSASTSEDLAFDTPSSSDDQSQVELDQLLLRTDATIPHSISKSPLANVEQMPNTSDVTISTEGYELGNASLSNTHAAQRFPPMVWAHSANEKGSMASTSRQVNGVHGHGRAGKGDSGRLKASEQLSPVTEVRTHSPGRGAGRGIGKGGPNFTTASVKNGVGITSGSLETSNEQTLPIPNGIAQSINGAASNTSSWQTQKKRKKSKRGTKSEADVPVIRGEGETAPLDESLRKGG